MIVNKAHRAYTHWDEESIDSGFSSDTDARYRCARDERRKRLSWYGDDTTKQSRDGADKPAKDNSRSLPSQFRDTRVDTHRLKDIALVDLEPVRYLGGGGYSRVDLVQLKRHHSKKGRLFALKKISKKLFNEPQQEKQFEAEKEVLALARSRFIPLLYRTFSSSNYVCLLTEACLSGDLFGYLERNGPMRSSAARYVIGCITEALGYLHNELGVVHRDVKTENVLIGENGVAKLADLGFCTEPGNARDLSYTFCGTPGYIAPEVLLHVGHNYSADYFSLGVVAYEVLTCRSPFRRNDVIDTHRATLRGITDVSFPCQLDHVTQSFVRALCYREPKRRLADEIRSHEWFYGFKWEELRSGHMNSPLKFSTSGLPTAPDEVQWEKHSNNT